MCFRPSCLAGHLNSMECFHGLSWRLMCSSAQVPERMWLFRFFWHSCHNKINQDLLKRIIPDWVACELRTTYHFGEFIQNGVILYTHGELSRVVNRHPCFQPFLCQLLTCQGIKKWKWIHAIGRSYSMRSAWLKGHHWVLCSLSTLMRDMQKDKLGWWEPICWVICQKFPFGVYCTTECRMFASEGFRYLISCYQFKLNTNVTKKFHPDTMH